MASISIKRTSKTKGFESELRRGMRRIDRYLARKPDEVTLDKIVNEYAQAALEEAVQYYDATAGEHNLTGNTRSSFCAGIYRNGKLFRVYTVLSGVYGLGIVKHDMYHYVNSGASGFQDRGSGEYVGSKYDPYVRDYRNGDKFINVDENGYAYLDTIEFLKNANPKYTKGLSIIVASVSPYVEYIHQALHLDILDSNAANAQTLMDFVISHNIEK